MANTLADFEKEQAQPKETIAPNPEASTGKEDVKPEQKESVVIIDGKERPLKNYEAELTRKHNEELERLRSDYESRVQPVQQTQPQPNWIDQVYQYAENEIATTGKAVPMNTIMQIANQIAQKNVETNFKVREQGSRAVKSFKRSVQVEPDFKELENDFDELVDMLKPEQINPPTLEVILNSVRGKRAKELYAKAQAKGKETALKEQEILGRPTEGSTAGATKPSTTLAPEAKADLDRMNKDSNVEWSEDDYKVALKKKQDRFKEMGAKNIPQTLNDSPIR